MSATYDKDAGQKRSGWSAAISVTTTRQWAAIREISSRLGMSAKTVAAAFL